MYVGLFLDMRCLCFYAIPLLNFYCLWIIVTDKHHISLPSFALSQSSNKPWKFQQFLCVPMSYIINQMQDN
jgi:hypothetical protein